MFWRVVMWPQPREYVIGDVGHHVELLGRDAAVGHLDSYHLVGAALTLAVDAVVEAEDAEHVLVELARRGSASRSSNLAMSAACLEVDLLAALPCMGGPRGRKRSWVPDVLG